VTAAEARVFAVLVKDVEKLTGFTFFGSLPAAVAEELRCRKPETRAKAEKPQPVTNLYR
jgi:hypothetical protein